MSRLPKWGGIKDCYGGGRNDSVFAMVVDLKMRWWRWLKWVSDGGLLFYVGKLNEVGRE